MKARVLLSDLARLSRAAWRHPAERRAATRLDLGLAWMEAEPVAGSLRRYRAGVTDLGPAPRTVRLVLDLWSEGGTPRQLSYLTIDLSTWPRARRVVEWTVTVDGAVRAHAGRERLAARLTPGRVPLSGPCAAILTLWHEDREVDRVTVRQRLEPVRT